MNIVRSVEKMTDSEKKLFYMCNARPILKMRALFSDATADYRYPEECEPGDTVRLRLRTGRFNVDKAYVYVNEQEYLMIVYWD